MAEEEKPKSEEPQENTLEVTEGSPNDEGESLESGVQDATAGKEPDKDDDVIVPKKSLAQKVQGLVGGINIYFLVFLLIIFIAGAATFASFKASKKATDVSISGQNLSTEDLQKLKNTDTSVGDAKQTLTI
jgi:hypothetical protein